jgi:AcrR family transcriptional regulator
MQIAMPTDRPTDTSVGSRVPLTRERVLRAAIKVADQRDIETLSMRKVGQELRVEAMSLYNHVANKDDLLDGMIDLLVSEIDIPANRGDWKASLRGSALSARALMQRHPWAPRLIAAHPPSRMGPAMLRYMDAVTNCLRHAGFSWEMAHHAGHVMGSRLLGYTQEPFATGDVERGRLPARDRTRRAIPAGEYPTLAAMLAQIRHDNEVEFAFGLDLIIEGLDRLRQTE